MKLRIGTKIGVGFGIVMILVAVNVFFAVSSLSGIASNAAIVEAANSRLELGNAIAYQYQKAVVSIRTYVAFGDPKIAERVEAELKETIRLENELQKIARPEMKNDIDQMLANSQKYSNIILNDYMPVTVAYHKATAAGNYAQAQEHKGKLNEIAKVVVPLSVEIDKVLKRVADENAKLVAHNLHDTVVSAQTTKTISMIIGVVALLLGGVLSIVLTLMVKKPVVELASVTEKYAQGDLRDIAQVTSSDELGDLAASLSTMRENISAIVTNIVHSSEQVAAASEELTASAEESAHAATQVASIITDIAQGSDKQVRSTNETTVAVEHMAAGIKQIAASAVNVAGMADKAAEAAGGGGKSVATAITQMDNIEKAVQESSTVVSKLGERSKEIGQIVDTISGIAGQTNLLALNAAIEAARAGEQGRGFAVVAEEVRKLAEQSQSAAKQIADLISEIQGDTDRAVLAMNEGTREVQAGTQVVNATGASFTEIMSLITEVSSQIREISAAIQQMAASSTQIVGSAKDIEEICKETAGQTQTVSAATEEQAASMQEIAASSQSLAKLAEELQGTVTRFKL
ncbi:MAG: mcpA 4 [Sporomusa sp.]|nr:mcpA 4 [Sporomusa sp.]